jgi:ankyrin repeat protein
LLPAVTSGLLPAVLLLIQAGADGDHDNASALMHAVGTDRLDITNAILLGQRPPSGPSLDKALDSVLSVPSAKLSARYSLIEVLLCGGPTGKAANDALFKATLLGNKDMMDLLLEYRVDINHNEASAVGHAIQRNRADLVATLLQDQPLKPEFASELVKHIPKAAPPSDKVAVLSKLLVNGASGTHCSELLITAAEQNDLETAYLLVSHGRDARNSSPVCSVDYNAARCLQVAVARNNVPMVKILALEGAPLKFSLAKAFESIPPRLSKDNHFLLVQTLLRAGAGGPEVDAALHSAVTGQHTSIRLIGLFVKSGAKVTDETLLEAVTQGNHQVVNLLLSGDVSPSTCAAAIPVAMKLPGPESRHKTIRTLIGPALSLGSELMQISQAVVDVIQNCPEDLPLLALLCREGKANVNFENGIAVSQAAKQGDPMVLDIVLNGAGSLPSAATVERALKIATDLQPSDLSRQHKIEALLKRVKPQDGMNAALIKEIKSVSAATQDFSVIKTLLAAGADVNANEGTKEGAPVCWAVTRNVPALVDLILSKRPTPRSVSLAFPLAFTFQDPERYVLSEKLLRAGAVGAVVSTALYKATKEGPAVLPLMQLLLPHADVNFKDGLALRIAVHHTFLGGVDLLLTPRAVMPSQATKIAAFQEALKLKTPKDRSQMVEKLLKAGIKSQAIAEGLIIAVNLADVELVEVLLKSGASIEYRGGQAVHIAVSCGENGILKLLVDGKLVAKPTLSTLTSGFGGASTMKVKNRETYHRIVQTLLEAGMRGEAIDDALVHAVKEGDSNLRLSELLFNSGASVEWHEGEAINVAAQSAFIGSLDLLLGKHVSESALKRACRSALELPKNQRFQVIERLLKAGKAVDKHVIRTLTSATMEIPSDRQLITLLLNHEVFDDGESIIHAARGLDLRTLTLLVNSPKADTCLSAAFKEAMTTDVLWQSSTGLAIVKLMLKRGATGDAVGEALYQAVEKCGTGRERLAGEFLDILLEFGADVNYQRGLALQRAAMQVDILLLEKLLPGATSESKAMAIPYLFTCCDDRATVLKAILAFGRSFPDGDPGVNIAFKHPDTNLEPLLFMALDKFPRDTQILRALLDMGFHANQWQLCEDDVDTGMEPWPILLWALERPEKKISSANIEMLIDEGGKSLLIAPLVVQY